MQGHHYGLKVFLGTFENDSFNTDGTQDYDGNTEQVLCT